MTMTITEIEQAARRPEAGASDVIVHDRGQLDPHDGMTVREVDRVLIRAGELDIEITRDEIDGPWLWEILDHPTEYGEITGPGNVLRLVHRALRSQGLSLPSGTPHPSRALMRALGDPTPAQLNNLPYAYGR